MRRDPGAAWTWRAALHESAHAVVLVALGLPLHDVVLSWPPTGSSVARYRADARPLPLIVAALAGPVAEAMATGDDPGRVLRTSGRSDLARVAGHGIHPDAAAVLARHAYQLVCRHADAVIAVAAALVAHPQQRLTYQQIVDLVDEAELHAALTRHRATITGPDPIRGHDQTETNT